MIAYLDASTLLRVVLTQRGALAEWPDIRRCVTSALTEVECLRTIDRLRLKSHVSDEHVAALRETVYRILERCEVVSVTDAVLRHAARPLPTLLGTLDAIHLATAVLWRDQAEVALTVATHDVALGTAARALGLHVVGT